MKPEFPKLIPIFPLSGVIYFPKTNLPLNIFEKRYLSLINDVMKTNKLMGMVQSIRGGEEVYKVGCLGKISDFRKSEDGRIIVNLTGLTRFEIEQEVSSSKLYREFDVQYEKFGSDIEINTNDLKKSDLDLLFEKSKDFFKRSGLMLNWKELEKLDQDQQVNTLAMISPISNEEKQKLLETVTLNEKIQTLASIIEFYLYERITDKTTIQ